MHGDAGILQPRDKKDQVFNRFRQAGELHYDERVAFAQILNDLFGNVIRRAENSGAARLLQQLFLRPHSTAGRTRVESDKHG